MKPKTRWRPVQASACRRRRRGKAGSLRADQRNFAGLRRRAVGPLPAELQNYVVFTAGISPNAKDAEAARTFVRFFTTPAALPVLKAKGMEPG
jgi:hypothetical protein